MVAVQTTGWLHTEPQQEIRSALTLRVQHCVGDEFIHAAGTDAFAYRDFHKPGAGRLE